MALVVVAVGPCARRRSTSPGTTTAPIANVLHAEASPVFRRLRRRYHLLVGGEVVALSLVGLAAVGLTMRPVSDRHPTGRSRNRDVMLCLDVSGSMIELDAVVLASSPTLAAGLRGERIGLTIFNGSAVSVFPLTDDAGYIAETLDDAATSLAERKRCSRGDEGGRQVADRRRARVVRDAFRPADEQRSRSIVFVTDNTLAGEPIMTIRQAAALVRDRDIRVYAIAADDRITAEDAAELRAAAEATGGAYFETDDARRRPPTSSTRSIGSRRAALEVPPEVGRGRPADNVDRRLPRRRSAPCSPSMGVAAMTRSHSLTPCVPCAVLVVAASLPPSPRGSACATAPPRLGVVRWSAMGVLLLLIAADPAIGGGRCRREALGRRRALRRRHHRQHGGRGLRRRRAAVRRCPRRHHGARRRVPRRPLRPRHVRLKTRRDRAVDHRRGAFDSAVELLRQERTLYAQGHAARRAVADDAQLLPRSGPGGGYDIVFFLCDGEQTEQPPPQSFDRLDTSSTAGRCSATAR